VLREKHGHRSVAGLNLERIVAGMLQPYADWPGAALGLIKNSSGIDQARYQHLMASTWSFGRHQAA
jgi:hypothetical protein